MRKRSLRIPEKVLLKSAAAWTPTHVEPTAGWPGQYTIIWRAPAFFGKISSSLKTKKRPTKRQLDNLLKKELLERFRSPLRCDAKRVAYAYVEQSGETIPMSDIHVAAKLAVDALYDLDAKLAGDFFSNSPPKLFMCSNYGWILGDLAEIRCAVAAMKDALEAKTEGTRGRCDTERTLRR